MIRTPQKVLRLFFAIFTLTTLLNSSVQLMFHKEMESHQGLLDRAVLILIGSLVFVIIDDMHFKNKTLKFALPYFLFMTLAMCYTYLTSVFWAELTATSYMWVFFKGTVVYLLVYGFQELPAYLKKRNEALLKSED